MRVVDAEGNVLMQHRVEAGDVWRMSRAKDIPIQDWVKLAVRRAKATGAPAVFFQAPAALNIERLARRRVLRGVAQDLVQLGRIHDRAGRDQCGSPRIVALAQVRQADGGRGGDRVRAGRS